MLYPNKAYLLIGGNVGNSLSAIDTAVILIQKQVGKVESRSSVYETAPWGNIDQEPFLNQALALDTALQATELMQHLLKIEEEMGRVRKEKYGPRIIDLDIIFFNNEIYNTPELTIPHKELQNRRFVLEPLAEIAPLYQHPVFKKNIRQLLLECKDSSLVKKISPGM